MADLIARAYAATQQWLALGHESFDVPDARVVRDRATPRVHDANFAARVRAESTADIDAVLRDIERAFEGLDHRHVVWDPETPPPFEARLALDGWQLRGDLVTFVLDGGLQASRSSVAIRAVETDADWRTIEDLHWLDHEEEVAMGFHSPWDRTLTNELVASKRSKSPDVRYFLARVDGVDCAFFSAWPGCNGLGVIEDLFTRVEFRGRGIGTALIAACIDDARARGAGSILISARANDTPKHMYAAMGFRPLCVQRSYLKELDPAPEP